MASWDVDDLLQAGGDRPLLGLAEVAVEVLLDAGPVDGGAAPRGAAVGGVGHAHDEALSLECGDIRLTRVRDNTARRPSSCMRRPHPWRGERAVFSAHATIDREDWGLTWNMVFEAGGLLVSKEIRLEIEVELVREV